MKKLIIALSVLSNLCAFAMPKNDTSTGEIINLSSSNLHTSKICDSLEAKLDILDERMMTFSDDYINCKETYSCIKEAGADYLSRKKALISFHYYFAKFNRECVE